ncbi:MAG: radical SAM protein [Desulfurococcaceae archaeon TW002]
MTTSGESVFRGGVKYVFIRASSALSKSGLPGLDYALNPYVGCYHKCSYCYARSYCRFEEPRTHWGDVIYVKKNIVDLLKSEVRRVRSGSVGLSTITDPYQPIEALTRLVRRSLEVLLKAGFKVVIQTKSPLVLRDLDVLVPYKDSVEVGFTITSVDDSVLRNIEVRAPPPKARIRALLRARDSGLVTWVFFGPIIPGLNDDSSTIEGVVEVARETGSTLYYDWLRYKEELRNFFGVIGLSPEKYRGHDFIAWRRSVVEELVRMCREKGVVCVPAFSS